MGDFRDKCVFMPRPISENGKELSRLIQEEATYICKAMDEIGRAHV